MAQTKLNGDIQLKIPESNLVKLTGSQVTGALDFASEASISSSSTTSVGALGSNNVYVTGTATITSLGTANAGTFRRLRFAGSLNITYNATSLILPTSGDIVTATNDIAEFRCETSNNWRCIKYSRADGTPLAGTSAALDAYINQDLRSLSLQVASLKGDRLNMMDGISDPFLDTTDINTTTSFGYSFSAGSITPLATLSVNSIGTPISGGDKGGANVKSAAFDSNTSTFWASSQAGSGINGAAYIGLQLSSAKLISSFSIYTATSSSVNLTSVLVQYSSDGTTWTTAATVAISSTASTLTTYNFSGGASATYWRILANSNNISSGNWQVPELTFYQNFTSVLVQSNAFTSDISSPGTARFAIQVSGSAVALTINTDLLGYVSRDGGTTFTQVTLAASQTFSDGSTIYDGTASIAGQPSGSSMVYKVTMPVVTKSIPLNGAVFQWRT